MTDLTNSGVSTLSFNSKDGYLFGYGIKRTTARDWERVTVRVDGKTGDVLTLGTVSDYRIISGSVVTLDEQHTVLYGYFAEPVKNSTAFDLVGTSVENRAQVVSHPKACANEYEKVFFCLFEFNLSLLFLLLNYL